MLFIFREDEITNELAKIESGEPPETAGIVNMCLRGWFVICFLVHSMLFIFFSYFV